MYDYLWHWVRISFSVVPSMSSIRFSNWLEDSYSQQWKIRLTNITKIKSTLWLFRPKLDPLIVCGQQFLWTLGYLRFKTLRSGHDNEHFEIEMATLNAWNESHTTVKTTILVFSKRLLFPSIGICFLFDFISVQSNQHINCICATTNKTPVANSSGQTRI